MTQEISRRSSTPVRRGQREIPYRLIVAGCVGLAVVSLVVPATLGFDPWSWLVWGREVARFDLDTTGGPSWKPYPVVFTTLFAPAGDAAVELWSVVARAGALVAVAATYRLAARFAGAGAGVVAAALLVLTPDGDPRFLRLFFEAHTAPTTAALLLVAADRHLDGHRTPVLVLLAVASLERPEAWPFLALYGIWCWRGEPRLRPLVAALAVAVPALWFGMDWWGSGSPWHGADVAQVSAGDGVVTRLVDAIGVIAAMVVVPAWLGAGVAWWSARREGDRALLGLGVAAAAWVALVAGMAVVLGYAALSRFMLPAAAVVCAVAGIGAVRVWDRARDRGVRAVVVVGALAFAAPRLIGLGPVVAEVVDRAALEDDLDAVLAAVGPDTLFACDDIAVDGVGLLRPAVAWKLDLPLHAAPRDLVDGTGVMLVRTGGDRDVAISRQPHTDVVLRTDEWSVLAVRCPAAAPSG